MPKDFRFAEFENVTATVWRLTSGTDDMLGETQAYAVDEYVEPFSVSLQPLSTSKQELFGRMGIVANLVAYMDAGPVLYDGDLLVIDGAEYKIAFQETHGQYDGLNVFLETMN